MKRTVWVLAIAAIMITTLTYVAIGQAPAPGQAPPAGAARGGAAGARGPVIAGPPQPVPPEVAIPRPTAAEVAQMNDEIAKMIDANKSAARPLLNKYRSLTVVQIPRDNSAIRPVPRNAAKHDSYVELAKKGDIDLLLVGDSITDLWRNSTETYATYFGKYKVGNFAISGDTTQGVLWGLQNGEGTGFQPKAIMMMIGTNNSNGDDNTPSQIVDGVTAIVKKLRIKLPATKILLVSIFPRNENYSAQRGKLAMINQVLHRLADEQNIFWSIAVSSF